MTTSTFHDTAEAIPWLLPALATLVGACVGSFLNVVIYRVPAGQSIVFPGSHCACGAPIAWFNNVPVLSWFLLRGKARCCGRRIPFRYAFVELLTAALFLACWCLLPIPKAIAGMVFLSVLIAASFIDMDHMIIPDSLTLGVGVAGVVLSFVFPGLHGVASGNQAADAVLSGTIALQGLLVGSGLLLWVALLAEALLKKETMGLGDVKLVGMIGAFCGWKGAVVSIFGGAVVGVLWFSVALIASKIAGRNAGLLPASHAESGQATALGMGVHVPFGPMIAIAAGAYYLGQPSIESWLAEMLLIT